MAKDGHTDISALKYTSKSLHQKIYNGWQRAQLRNMYRLKWTWRTCIYWLIVYYMGFYEIDPVSMDVHWIVSPTRGNLAWKRVLRSQSFQLREPCYLCSLRYFRYRGLSDRISVQLYHSNVLEHRSWPIALATSDGILRTSFTVRSLDDEVTYG